MNCLHCGQPIGIDNPHWHPEQRALTNGRRLATLSEGQARVFGILWNFHKRGEGCSASIIAERLGLRPHSVSSIMAGIRPKMRPLGLTINGEKGKGGGYRLVACGESGVVITGHAREILPVPALPKPEGAA